VHCHDDLGLAVANSLSAVLAGARQIECTINGIGERAGNCSLEEVVMALKTRETYFRVHTGVDTTRLYPTSRLVSSITGMPIPRNKAVIGENAFAHESGIHQHGMLRHHSTYEIMRPEDVGLSRTQLVLGKHSGRHAFRERVRELGFELDEAELNRVFEEFKALADKKKELFDGDIRHFRGPGGRRRPWSLERLDVDAHMGTPRARVVLAYGRPQRRARSRIMARRRRHKAVEKAAASGNLRKFEGTRSRLARARRARPSSTSITPTAAIAAESAPTSSRPPAARCSR
jgi:2-isopropylmalate synthase